MIINGTAVKGASRLANHLVKQENEHVEILEISGTASDHNLKDALLDMEAMGVLTQSQTGKVLYHANLDPKENETLTKEQYVHSCDLLMSELGFTGQPRAIVMHVKNGRQHAHLVDTQKGKLKPISNNYYKHREIAQELEKQFCLEKAPRTKTGKSYSQKEAQQAKRLDKTVRQHHLIIRDCFDRAKNGEELIYNLSKKDMILAKGKRVVVLDKNGNAQSLSRQLSAFVKGKRVREKIKDIEKDLPPIELAQKLIRQKSHEQNLENAQSTMTTQKNGFKQDQEINTKQELFARYINEYKGRRKSDHDRDMRF